MQPISCGRTARRYRPRTMTLGRPAQRTGLSNQTDRESPYLPCPWISEFAGGILDNLFDVPKSLLGLSLDLFLQTLGLLLLASNQFPGFLLDFAGDILDRTLDLAFVDHDYCVSVDGD